MGRARRGPRARPRGARDRRGAAAPAATGPGWSRTAASARCARATGTGPPASWTSGWRSSPPRSCGPSASWTARSSARSGARTRPRTSRRRPGSWVEDGVTGPQIEAYELWAEAWAAFAGGRPDEVRRLGEHAVELMSYLRSARLPAPRPERAVGRRRRRSRLGPGLTRRLRDTSARPWRPIASSPAPGSTPSRGVARPRWRGTARRCAPTASSGSPSTRRRRPWTWPILLRSPERDAADVGTAIGAARDTLERLDARPFLARLDAARTLQPAG